VRNCCVLSFNCWTYRYISERVPEAVVNLHMCSDIVVFCMKSDCVVFPVGNFLCPCSWINF
jgi:hypothetical protein